MTTKFFFALALFLTLTSCASNIALMNADKNMRNLKIGMTKQDVIKIMGSNYKSAGAERSVDGSTLEKISYDNLSNEEYQLELHNDTLVRWNKIFKFNPEDFRRRRDTIYR